MPTIYIFYRYRDGGVFKFFSHQKSFVLEAENEDAKKVWLDEGTVSNHRFHHVSTDEVYGTLGARDPAFSEITPYAPNSPYAASKAGLEALGQCWAAEVASTPLKVNILNPGGVATRMFASAYPGADLAAMPQPDDISPAFVALAAEDCPYHGEILRASQLVGG